MEKNRKIISLLFLSFLISACQEVMYFDSGATPRIVINSVLKAGDDIIGLQVSLTHPIGDTVWKQIENAEAVLFENGEKIGAFHLLRPGWYSITHPVQAAHTYRIEVSVPDYGRAWGETTVPRTIQKGRIEIDPPRNPYGAVLVDLYWQDDPRDRNFYWIGGAYSTVFTSEVSPAQDSTLLYLNNTYYTRSPLPDPFNRIFDESDFSSVFYEYLIRIEDSGRSGADLHLLYRSNIGAGRYKAFLLSTDLHYDAYLKSSILNRENTDNMEMLPLYYEPAYTYSNIHGGTGLVASYVHIEKMYYPDYENFFDTAFTSSIVE